MRLKMNMLFVRRLLFGILNLGGGAGGVVVGKSHTSSNSMLSSRCKKYFVRISVLFLVYVMCVYVSSRKKSDIPNTYYVNIDREVDTSSYLEELAKFNLVRYRKSNAVANIGSDVKQVLRDKRALSSRFKSEYAVALFTNIFYERPGFCDNPKSMYVDQCPYKNCKFTCDRKNARFADMVMFHAYDLLNEDVETRVYVKSFLAHQPSRRNQVWLLWHDEVSIVYLIIWTIFKV